METIELKEIRKELKKIGFSVRTEKNSFGISATLCMDKGKNIADTGNVYTKEDLALWKPAHDILAKYAKCSIVRNGEKVYGLKK